MHRLFFLVFFLGEISFPRINHCAYGSQEVNQQSSQRAVSGEAKDLSQAKDLNQTDNSSQAKKKDDPQTHQTQENPIQELKEIQEKIKAILPRVLPCVVSVEGGSGVIVSSDGLILTASHVAGRAGRTVKVGFPDGSEAEAITLGTNNHTDTSALRLKTDGPWKHLSIVKAENIEPGQWCIALGYPSSFPRNKPPAIRLGRVLTNDCSELTTDCTIMGGDSGGPLLNLNGNLIGINSRVKNGIEDNYHIPSEVFREGWSDIVAFSDVRKRSSPTGQRAYLGLFAESDEDRVRIRQVHPNSPAKNAGLAAEDVIFEFAEKRITSFDEILEIVEGRKPGEKITVIVNRFGQILKTELTLGSPY